MVVAGSIATLIGVVVALILEEKVLDHVIDANGLTGKPGTYVINHPARVGLGIGIVILVSYGLAWAMARFAPGRGAEVFPDSAWYSLFERRLPQKHAIAATVELKDGRRVAGLVRAFTAEPTPVDDRELTLARSTTDTMKVMLPSGEMTELAEQFIALRGSDIANVAATYVPTED